MINKSELIELFIGSIDKKELSKEVIKEIKKDDELQRYIGYEARQSIAKSILEDDESKEYIIKYLREYTIRYIIVELKKVITKNIIQFIFNDNDGDIEISIDNLLKEMKDKK